MDQLVLPPAMIETVTLAADWVIVLPLVLALLGAALMLMLRKTSTLSFMFALLIVVGIIACETSLLRV
jgi:multicomponent Na+:H+ antiporter subunit D